MSSTLRNISTPVTVVVVSTRPPRTTFTCLPDPDRCRTRPCRSRPCPRSWMVKMSSTGIRKDAVPVGDATVASASGRRRTGRGWRRSPRSRSCFDAPCRPSSVPNGQQAHHDLSPSVARVDLAPRRCRAARPPARRRTVSTIASRSARVSARCSIGRRNSTSRVGRGAAAADQRGQRHVAALPVVGELRGVLDGVLHQPELVLPAPVDAGHDAQHQLVEPLPPGRQLGDAGLPRQHARAAHPAPAPVAAVVRPGRAVVHVPSLASLSCPTGAARLDEPRRRGSTVAA